MDQQRHEKFLVGTHPDCNISELFVITWHGLALFSSLSSNWLFIKLTDNVMRIYIKTMTDDDDKEVVAQACMSVADIFKDYGFVAVEPCKCCCSGLHSTFEIRNFCTLLLHLDSNLVLFQICLSLLMQPWYCLEKNQLVSNQIMIVTMMMLILNMMKSLWMQFLTFFLHLQNLWVHILHRSLSTYLNLWWNLQWVSSLYLWHIYSLSMPWLSCYVILLFWVMGTAEIFTSSTRSDYGGCLPCWSCSKYGSSNSQLCWCNKSEYELMYFKTLDPNQFSSSV